MYDAERIVMYIIYIRDGPISLMHPDSVSSRIIFGKCCAHVHRGTESVHNFKQSIQFVTLHILYSDGSKS